MKKQKINKISREKKKGTKNKKVEERVRIKPKLTVEEGGKTCQSRVKAKNEEEVVDGCGCLMYNE